MRGRIALALAAGIILGRTAAAGDAEFRGLKVGWSAVVSSTTWHDQNGETSVSRNEQALSLQLHTDPDRRWQVVTSLDLVAGSEMPRVRLQGDGAVEEDDQWQLRSDAAYLDVKDLLVDGLDLRIGRQVLVWGAADAFNPTDSLSSKSFENPVKFGENLPSPAVNVHYHVAGFDVNGIYVDRFQAPRLPPGIEERFFSSGRIPPSFRELAEQFEEQDGTVSLRLRPDVPSSSLWGLRVARNVGGVDLSASYADTHDSVPVLRTLHVLAFDPVALEASVEAEAYFPRKRVYGMDASGQLSFLDDAGVWAEVAWHDPEPDVLQVDFLGQPLGAEPILDEGYLRYTVGGDYTFESGYLVQLQVIRGFVDENTADLMHHYVSAGFEKSYFTDTLRVRVFEVFNTADRGLLVNPDVLWRASDHLEIGGGALLYAGRTGSAFEATPTGDQYYLELRYAF